MLLKDFKLSIGDCIFTYQGSWLNKQIMWFSKWRVPKNRTETIAHVAMYIGDNAKGEPQVFEADWKGLSVNSGLGYNNKKFTIHTASPIGIIIDQYHIEKLNSFIHNNLKTHYAFLQLAGIATKKILGLHRIGDWDKDAMICSECYCETLKHVWGVVLTDNPEGITPLDIYYSKKMSVNQPEG